MSVVMISNMKARLLIDHRETLSAHAFFELVLWHLPRPVEGCTHTFKYRLAYVVDEVCVVRYDNERGKGDHRHFDGKESAFAFSSPEALLKAFNTDIKRWNDENSDF